MIAAQFTDPENARIIFFAAGGLLVIAIGVVVATIVWWRSSGIEPTALAPLEQALEVVSGSVTNARFRCTDSTCRLEAGHATTNDPVPSGFD